MNQKTFTHDTHKNEKLSSRDDAIDIGNLITATEVVKDMVAHAESLSNTLATEQDLLKLKIDNIESRLIHRGSKMELSDAIDSVASSNASVFEMLQDRIDSSNKRIFELEEQLEEKNKYVDQLLTLVESQSEKLKELEERLDALSVTVNALTAQIVGMPAGGSGPFYHVNGPIWTDSGPTLSTNKKPASDASKTSKPKRNGKSSMYTLTSMDNEELAGTGLEWREVL